MSVSVILPLLPCLLVWSCATFPSNVVIPSVSLLFYFITLRGENLIKEQVFKIKKPHTLEHISINFIF